MAIDSQASKLQKGFLELSHITPASVKSLLGPLAQRQPQWVALAVLQCFTDSQRAKQVSSTEAVEALLAAGLQAASSSPSSSSSSSSSSSNAQHALALANESFQAWQKTGLAVHLQDAQPLSQPLDDEEDDEDSAWFDTKQSQTPSPAPTAAPSIHLASLLLTLTRPRKTALLLAPYPQRLVVWLKALSPASFKTYVWQRRFEIVEASLRHLAIAQESLDELAAARLLPAMGSGDDVWHQLLEGQGEESGKSTSPLEWYHAQARSLDSRYGASALALQLAHAALVNAPADNDVTSGLQRLRSELEASESFGTQVASTTVDPSRDPASSICQGLVAGTLAGQGLERALTFAATTSKQSQDVITRQVCWQLAQQEQTKSIPGFLEAARVSQDDRTRIALAVLLTATSARQGVKELESLLRAAQPHSQATQSLSVGLLSRFSQDKSAPQPTGEEVFAALTDEGDITTLVQRSQVWLQTLSQLRLRDVFSTVAPWRVITATSDKEQTEVLSRCLQDRSSSSSSSPQEWLVIHSALLALCGPGQLLDALDPPAVSCIVIRATLQAASVSEHHLEAAKAVISQAIEPPSQVDSHTIDGLVIEAARDILDRAQGGRQGVADVKKARQCLSVVAPASSSSSSSSADPISASLSFTSAVLRLMQLSHPLPSALHPSVQMTPLEIRLSRDKLDVVRRWLGSAHDNAWRRRDDVVETAHGLCAGGMTRAVGESDDAAATPVSSRSKEAIRVQVLAMLAETAMSHSDLAQTTEYLDEMQAALDVLLRKAKRSSTTATVAEGTAMEEEAATARETAWTTFFTMSKHPNCHQHHDGSGSSSADGGYAGAAATSRSKQWLGAAIRLAPPERLPDLLKRWQALVAEEGDASEQDVSAMGAAIAAVGHPSALSASPAQAVQGLGAGVFSLAAAAVNSTAWSLSGAGTPSSSKGVGAATSTSHAAAAGGASALGHALSSLAGHGHRFRSGLWGVANAASGSSTSPSGSPSLSTGKELPEQTAGPAASQQRSAASLFDGLGDSSDRPGRNRSMDVPGITEQGRSSSPSTAASSLPFGSYLDPAERAARAARGFLGGGGGGGGGSSSSGGGWTSLGSRGMNWLVGEEERQQQQAQ